MSHAPHPLYTCFNGHRRMATGPLETVALAVKQAVESGAVGPVLIFDDTSGRSIDLDMRGSDQDMLARLATHPANTADRAEPEQADDPLQAPPDSIENPTRGRGRPKLGVVAREVTLLPRHWDWLAEQAGGASVALRKLVDGKRSMNDATQRCVGV